MNTHRTTRKDRNRINILFAFFGLLILLAVSMPTQFATASHTTGRFSTQFAGNPCDDGLIQQSTPPGGGRGSGSFGGGFGIFVPVRDSAAIANLQAIVSNTDAIADNTDAILANVENIEGDTQVIREYLRLLCEKEFEEDHTIQQAWTAVISQFVDRAMNFVRNAYSQKPIFVTNPYVYYSNVEHGVLKVLIKEIEKRREDGFLEIEAANDAIRTLLLKNNDKLFPDLVGGFRVVPEGTVVAVGFEDTAGRIFSYRVDIKPDDFNRSWDDYITLWFGAANSTYSLSALAEQEYLERAAQARAGEAEKLAWGRGFFPWEFCGQPVFSGDPEDVRTCVTLTPGSVIQDMTVLTLGSALRQMENADEYEEWISARALWAANSVFTKYGLINDQTVLSTLQGRAGTQNAIGPAQAEISIDVTDLEENFVETGIRYGAVESGVKGDIFLNADFPDDIEVTLPEPGDGGINI